MALAQPVFERDQFTNEYKLTKTAKKLLKELLQAQELSRFMDQVGYTPKPDGSYPRSGPIGALVKELMGDISLDKIVNASTKKGSLSIIDAMRREGIAKEAFNELSEQITSFQKSLTNKAKASA